QVDRSCGDVNCNGRALRVPDDVPDIATALARRAPGDTVCLGVGTFPVEVSTDASADPIRLRGVNQIIQDRTILVPVASGRTLLETRSGLDLQALTVVADDAPALVVHNGDVLLSEVRLTGTGGLTPTSRPTCTGLLLDQRALPRSTRLERVHVVDVNCGAAGVTAGDPGLVRTAGPLELIDVYVGDVDLDQRRGLTGGLFRGGRLSRVDGLVVEGVWIASEGLVQGAVLSAASLSSVHDVRVDGLGVEAPALRGGLVHTTLAAGATTTLTRVALRDVALVSQGVGDELTGIVAYAAGSAPVPAGELEVRQLLVAGLVVSTGYTHGGGRLLHAMAGHGTLAYATIVGIEDWSAGSFSARIGHAAHGWDARGVVVAWDDSTRHDDAWFVSATGGWNAVWTAEWTDVPSAPWVGVPGFVTPAPDSVLPTPQEVAGWDLHLAQGSPLLQRGPPDEEDGATGKRASIGAYGGPDGSW
ncbi:MAG: hypothetical protein KC656_27965, partial [Myxococcales bacterium]|nr:hypothetical protein [Myxococcales bacterium]